MLDLYKRGWLMDEAAEGDGGGGGDVLPPVQTKAQEAPDPLAERLARLEKAINQRPVPQPVQQHSAQPSVDDLNREFYKNPSAMLAQAVQYAQQAGAQQAIQTMAPTLIDVAMKTARESDPEVFDLLRTEIVAKMSEVPDNYRTNTTVWVNAFNSAKGENIDKVLAHHKAQTGNRTTVKNDGPISPASKPVAAPKAPTMSDDEARFIKKFRTTPEKYQRGKEIIANQNMSGHPHEPTSWDSVITFDSDNPPEASKRWAEVRKSGRGW